MKVSKDRFGLVSAALALLAASALVAAGVVGLGLAPAKKAEASSALRLEQSSSHDSLATSATADLDAADKSAALKKTAKALPAATVLVAAPRKAKTSAKASARKRITVSRGSHVRARSVRVTSGGWRFARVSWYGPGFYGHTMAGGGTLTRTSMVVAHRSLPFGTRVEFRYRGRTCVAVVKDRGPYVAGRTFDLGPGTAAALGFSGASTVSCRIIGR